MTWMLTATGAQFDLHLATPESISILDIAAALAKINRFGGHTSRLYSVAEHSLHVSSVMERELGIGSPWALLAGLLHDAHEAYTGDLPSPVKAALNARTDGGWRKFEDRIAAQVRGRFGLLAASAGWRGSVHQADLMMLATERAQLMPPIGPDWPALAGVPCSGELHLEDYGGMDWDDWRDAFLERFVELRESCRLAHGSPGLPPQQHEAGHA